MKLKELSLVIIFTGVSLSGCNYNSGDDNDPTRAGNNSYTAVESNVAKSKNPKSAKLKLAEPVTPVVLSYWTGWGNNMMPDQDFDGVLLSFAILNFNGDSIYTSYDASGNFQDPTQKDSMYKIWNPWVNKYKKPAIVSFGGGTNHQVRSYIINASDQQLTNLALEIKANLVKYNFDGVDLDFEEWWAFDNANNVKFAKQFASFIIKLRKSMDNDIATKNKPIAIAVNWNAVENNNIKDLWFDPAYAGTMRDFFKNSAANNAISKVMVMSYNICDPTKFAYNRQDVIVNILKSFEDAGVSKNKLFFGFQPRECAFPDNPAYNSITSLTDAKNLANFVASSGYGGVYMWAIGDTAIPASPTTSEYLAALKGSEHPLPPSPSAVFKLQIDNNGSSADVVTLIQNINQKDKYYPFPEISGGGKSDLWCSQAAMPYDQNCRNSWNLDQLKSGDVVKVQITPKGKPAWTCDYGSFVLSKEYIHIMFNSDVKDCEIQ